MITFVVLVLVSIAIGLPAELACMHDDVQTLGVLLKKMPDGQWWKRPLMQTAVRRDAAAAGRCSGRRSLFRQPAGEGR